MQFTWNFSVYMSKDYIYIHTLPEMFYCLKGRKFNEVKLIWSCVLYFIIKAYFHFSFAISLLSLQNAFSQPTPMQILTTLEDISQVIYLFQSSNQQTSPANTDHSLL